MRIIVDTNIPFAEEAFSPFGEVVLLPGRTMENKDLKGADALIVRSITKVNEGLLEGHDLKFVGTATIGTDHLDIPFLERKGIPWSSAAGCNARSVVEWVMTVFFDYAQSYQLPWRDLKVGIVGHGNIGSRLAPLLRKLGVEVLVNDPPLARAGQLDEHVSLEQVLTECDVVTCHVPYIREGEDCTHHLLSWEELAMMKPRSAVVNASRGVVLNNEAALKYGRTDSLVFLLDVYENEPNPDRDLIQYALHASPHVAGYSLEGKTNGTSRMVQELARALDQESNWKPDLGVPEKSTLVPEGRKEELVLSETLMKVCPVRRDTSHLREGLAIEDENRRGEHFDQLRKNYPVRREFVNYTIDPSCISNDLTEVFRILGFQIKS